MSFTVLRNHRSLRVLTYVLMAQMVFPPAFIGHVYAAAITDPKAEVKFRPVINTTANGVPVVNIVNPDKNGLSHNKYQDFDIDENGLVFNNALVGGNSRLAGYLAANPLLVGRSANLILNEVTGVSDSQLAGIAEVHGGNANVIIANPNGITCNGCGFINTNRLTLTTGTPFYSGEALNFRIDRGQVDFAEEGYSYLTYLSQLDVLARYIRVNGQVNTESSINLNAGAFDYAYTKSLNQNNDLISNIQSNPEQSGIAIDASIFGAMQSGTINMMATENGLGVKLDGYLFAQSDALFIKSNGDVSIANADAFGDLNVLARDDLAINGALLSNSQVQLNARNIQAVDGTSMIAAGVAMTAQRDLSLSSEVSALDVSLTAQNIALNGSSAGQNQHGRYLALNTMSLNAAGSLNADTADIYADALNMQTGDIQLNDAIVNARSAQINATGNTDFTAAKLDAGVLDMNARDASMQGGYINANQITLHADNLSRIGSTLTAAHADVVVQGDLTSQEDLWTVLSAEHGNGQLNITTGNMDWATSNIASDTTNINASGNIQLRDQSVLLSQNAVSLQAGNALTLNESNVNSVADSVTLSANDISLQDAYLSAQHDMTMQAADITIDEKTYATAADHRLAATNINNSGAIAAADSLTLDVTQQLNNAGLLLATDIALNADVPGSSVQLHNQQGGVVRQVNGADHNGTLQIAGFDSVINQGIMQAEGILTLQNINQLDNSYVDAAQKQTDISAVQIKSDTGINIDINHAFNNDGLIITQGLAVTAGSIENTGLLAASEANIHATQGELQNSGQIMQRNTQTSDATRAALHTSQSTFNITAQGMTNQQGGVIQLNQGTLNIQNSELNNAGLIRSAENASGAVDITQVSHLTNSGDIAINGTLDINQALNNTNADAYIYANNIHTQQLEDFSNLGTILAGAQLSLSFNGQNVQNSGTLGAQGITLGNAANFDNTGNLLADESLQLQVGQLDNTGRIETAGDLTINSAGIYNHKAQDDNTTGVILATGQIDLTANGNTADINNQGTLQAGTGFNISMRHFDNTGYIYAEGQSLWQIQDFYNQAGGVVSIDGDLAIGSASQRAGSFNNAGEFYAGSASLFGNGGFKNTGVIAIYSSGFNMDLSGAIDAYNYGEIYTRDGVGLKLSDYDFYNLGSIFTLNSNGGNFLSLGDGYFYNGYEGISSGRFYAQGDVEFSGGAFINSYSFKEGEFEDLYYRGVNYFNSNDQSGGSFYYYYYYVNLVEGVYKDNIDKSFLSVGGDFVVNSTSFENVASDVYVGGLFDLNGVEFVGNDSYLQSGNILKMHFYQRNTDTEDYKKIYGNNLETKYLSELDLPVGDRTAEALILSKIGIDNNGNYYMTDPFGVPSTSYFSIDSKSGFEFVNPYGVGIISAGDIVGSGSLSNTGSLNAGTITFKAERNTVDAVDSTPTPTKSSFNNGLSDNVLNLANPEPSQVISLAGLLDPALSWNVLENADATGNLAQKETNEAALNQNVRPNLANLNPDILNKLAAGTDYDFTQDYLFDRVDPARVTVTEPDFFLDPYQEAQLLQQAALQQTGEAYFSPEWHTAAQQRQGLFDNTLEFMQKEEAANLGEPLSALQIAALDKPLMWYVNTQVNGEDHFVPVVYLPTADLEQYNKPVAGSITAQRMDIDVGEFENTGDINVAGEANISADHIVNRKTVFTAQNGTDLFSLAGTGGNISAGELNMHSRGDIDNQGGSLNSTGAMLLDAQGNINLSAVALQNNQGGSNNRTEQTRYLLSQINAGGNASFNAEGNFNSQASQVNVGGNLDIAATDIDLSGVQERDYSKETTKKSGTFSSSKTTKEEEFLTFLGNKFNVGGNASLNAENDITMTGASLEIAGNASLDAGGDILLTAGISQETVSMTKTSSGAVTQSSQAKGHITQSTVGSSIFSGGNLSMNSDGGAIDILATELTSAGAMELGNSLILRDERGAPVMDEFGRYVAADGGAVANVTIGTVELQNESWDEKQSGLKGPLKNLAAAAMFAASSMGISQQAGALGIDTNLNVGHSEETRVTQTQHVASDVYAQAGLRIDTQGDLNIEGSQVSTAGDADINAHSITITAVLDSTTTEHSESDQSINTTAPAVGKQEVTVAGVTATDHSVTDTLTVQTAVRAGLNVGGTLTMDAEQDINVLGSEVNVDGDAKVTATNITVAGVDETTTNTHKETTEVVTTSVGIKNAYVDAAYAADAVVQAGAQVDAAQHALDDAERRVKDGTLAASALDEYKANLVAATTQFAQANLNLLAAGGAAAGAAASSGGTGFYVSGSAQTTTTESTQTSTQTRFVGSAFNVGGSASLVAKEQLNITGSSVAVTDALTLNAAEINITAGVEESSSHSSSHTNSAGGSFSSNGNSVSANASTNSSESDSYSKTHITSLITAGSLNSTSERLNIIGGNVEVQNDIDITTKELTIASVQDESHSSSSSQGFNVGGSGNLGNAPSASLSSVGGSYNESNSDSKWVNNQSSLIGGLSGNGAVTITADKTVLTGAMLASATRNEDGTLTDNGTLNLTTEVLEVNNLYDYNTSDSRGINLNVSTARSGDNPDTPEKEGYASGTSSLGLNHSGHNTQQTSFATLGGGTVQKKDGTAHDVANVNSDLNNTQEITKDQDTGGLDATFTLDHRLTSEEGRDAIAEDAAKTNMFLNTIKLIATTERVGIEDFFTETAIQNNTLEALKAKIAADPELAAQLQNPDLTPAEKEQMLNSLTHTVMQELGFISEDYDNRIVAVDDPVTQDGQTYQRLGFYSDETGDAYINDAHLDNTEQLVTVAGHELSHAMDARNDASYSDTDNELYATSFGLNFANYTDLALDLNGYDSGMASDNGHRGYYAPQLSYNNQEYSLLDKSQGDSFGPAAALIIPAVEAVGGGAALSEGAVVVTAAVNTVGFFFVQSLPSMLGIETQSPTVLTTPIMVPVSSNTQTTDRSGDVDNNLLTTPWLENTLGGIYGYPADGVDVNANSGGYQGSPIEFDNLIMWAEGADNRLSGSNVNHVNGAIGEIRGHQEAIDMGHESIRSPGKVTAPGVDYITFDATTGEIVLWDSKYRREGGSYPSSVPDGKAARWTEEAKQAVENLPESSLKDEALDAIKNGRVRSEISRWPR